MRALSIASTGLEAQQLAVEVIANNLANVSTTGFKKSTAQFQDLFYQTLKAAGTTTDIGTLPVGIQVGSGVQPVSVHRTFQQGDFIQTGNSLDIAVEGEGFFQITLPDGTLAYTRAGAFRLDNEGNIVTSGGYPLTPSLSISPDVQTISISPGGIMSIITASNAIPTQVGTIELARFPNPSGLNSAGKSLFQSTQASGEPITGVPSLSGFGSILQASLENSNVNIAEEMVNMIIAQRAYEVNSKVIQSSDEMMSVANNLKR